MPARLQQSGMSMELDVQSGTREAADLVAWNLQADGRACERRAPVHACTTRETLRPDVLGFPGPASQPPHQLENILAHCAD